MFSQPHKPHLIERAAFLMLPGRSPRTWQWSGRGSPVTWRHNAHEPPAVRHARRAGLLRRSAPAGGHRATNHIRARRPAPHTVIREKRGRSPQALPRFSCPSSSRPPVTTDSDAHGEQARDPLTLRPLSIPNHGRRS